MPLTVQERRCNWAGACTFHDVLCCASVKFAPLAVYLCSECQMPTLHSRPVAELIDFCVMLAGSGANAKAAADEDSLLDDEALKCTICLNLCERPVTVRAVAASGCLAA